MVEANSGLYEVIGMSKSREAGLESPVYDVAEREVEPVHRKHGKLNPSDYSMTTVDNICYSTASKPAQAITAEDDSPGTPKIVSEKRMGKKDASFKAINVCIFVTIASVALVTFACIVILSIQFAKLKTQTASLYSTLEKDVNTTVEMLLQLQMGKFNLSIEKSIQQINSSIHNYLMMFSEDIINIDDHYWLLEQNLGLAKSFPAYSCATLPSFLASGYYFIRASDGSPARVYCDMTRSCGGVIGGWRRVAYLDMTNSSHQCPSGLKVENSTCNSVRTCVRNESAGGCSSVLFATHNIRYSRICGRIGAYRHGLTDGFNNVLDINKTYVDGVSLTHGNPRQHIWTLAAALNESSCSCNHSNPEGESPPEVVGNDYFCDSGRRGANIVSLWQGANCTVTANGCCSFNNPPWFHKLLPQPTTDDIEMRDGDRDEEDVRIEIIEIYVLT